MGEKMSIWLFWFLGPSDFILVVSLWLQNSAVKYVMINDRNNAKCHIYCIISFKFNFNLTLHFSQRHWKGLVWRMCALLHGSHHAHAQKQVYQHLKVAGQTRIWLACHALLCPTASYSLQPTSSSTYGHKIVTAWPALFYFLSILG